MPEPQQQETETGALVTRSDDEIQRAWWAAGGDALSELGGLPERVTMDQLRAFAASLPTGDGERGLREALNFYANLDNYYEGAPGEWGTEYHQGRRRDERCWWMENGRRARAALAASPSTGGSERGAMLREAAELLRQYVGEVGSPWTERGAAEVRALADRLDALAPSPSSGESGLVAFCEECGARVEHRLGAWFCPTHHDRGHVRFYADTLRDGSFSWPVSNHDTQEEAETKAAQGVGERVVRKRMVPPAGESAEPGDHDDPIGDVGLVSAEDAPYPPRQVWAAARSLASAIDQIDLDRAEDEIRAAYYLNAQDALIASRDAASCVHGSGRIDGACSRCLAPVAPDEAYPEPGEGARS